MKDTAKRSLDQWVGLAGLALCLGVLGAQIVPAHWTSLWNDREFSGWVAPIANRLSGGIRLYEDGLHTPMPPLPFVLVHWLHPHGAPWIAESLLNFAFQAATLLVLYWAFAKRLGAGTAFATTLAAIPVFFALPKEILYDSMAQFLVALIGWSTAGLVGPPPKDNKPDQSRGSLLLVLLGVELALLLLTKQNTAVGAILGAVVVLLSLPRVSTWTARARRVLLCLGWTLICLAILVAVLRPWSQPWGLVCDVFLTGSEPKGGGLRLVRNLLTYWAQCVVVVGGFFLLHRICQSIYATGAEEKRACRTDAVSFPAGFFEMAVAAGLGSLAGFGLGIVLARTALPLLPLDRAWPTILLNAGLAGCLLGGGASLIPVRFRPTGLPVAQPLAPFIVVFLFSAWFHSLSVKQFYWSYYNNPLIFVALAFVVSGLTRPAAAQPPGGAPRFAWLLVSVVMVLLWLGATDQISAVTQCRDGWPEIRHLAGARLRPQAQGMRELVRLVRSLADPAARDEVLLLPDDPNVEAWLERPRPALSSAIVFTDQYWDRYVDRDFETLKARPPKVIVIGPRDYWRAFSRKWNVKRGAERLINRVQEELLPQGYTLSAEVPITYQDRAEIMQVYVRHS